MTYAFQAQVQIATFFASDGATIIDPDLAGPFFDARVHFAVCENGEVRIPAWHPSPWSGSQWIRHKTIRISCGISMACGRLYAGAGEEGFCADDVDAGLGVDELGDVYVAGD